MTRLSVNINKVATVRNARLADEPSVVAAARTCLEAGAAGITVHPRPDGRHIRYQDVHDLKGVLREWPGSELNVEGNPVADFMALVLDVRPEQCTLVPDSPQALTSSFGWNVIEDGARLRAIVARLQREGIRVSIFMDPDPRQIAGLAHVRPDRIELYTEPYARTYSTPEHPDVLGKYVAAAVAAHELGLGVNAGHDLSLVNVGTFCRAVPDVLEVSIGHALIARALDVGLGRAVQEYLEAIDEVPIENGLPGGGGGT
jgi:pyridoxine 5-phosphate synthase